MPKLLAHFVKKIPALAKNCHLCAAPKPLFRPLSSLPGLLSISKTRVTLACDVQCSLFVTECQKEEENVLFTRAGTENNDSHMEIISLFSQKDVNSYYIAPQVCVISNPVIHLLFSQK